MVAQELGSRHLAARRRNIGVLGLVNDESITAVRGDLVSSIIVQLSPGEFYDIGVRDYGEFLTHPDTADQILELGRPPFATSPGRVTVIARHENATQLRWVPDTPAWRWPK
jgi:hypothetical protein